MLLSASESFKRKASRAGMWPKHFKMSASEFVIPEIYNKLQIKQRSCFARLSSNHSFLGYVPKTRATLRSESPVPRRGAGQLARHLTPAPSLWISIAREPSKRAGRRRSRGLTLTRGTRSLLAIGCVRTFESASTGLASWVEFVSLP